MIHAFQHCRDLVAANDKERYWASLYAPADRRGALYALYAFNLELAAVRERAREPMAGEIRLQWWREVLQGERNGEAAAHPIAAALTASLQKNGLSAAPLLGLIEARSFDLYDDPMPNLAAFEAYAAATAGVLFDTAARILGAATADDLGRHAGLAQGYVSILTGFPRHAARGQLYIPAEVLDRHGVDRDGMFTGKASFELRAALAELRLHARRHLAAADSLRPSLSQNVLPAFLPAALIRPTLTRMEKRSYQPFGVNELPLWRRQWLLWRAARDPGRIFG
jgi:phytoene synthase